MIQNNAFNPLKVSLTGRNLVEASAGTGKTYSIALLVLRMVVEQDAEVSRILMVTYTKAAVAELEGRIRQFIRLAYRFAQNPTHEKVDEQIQNIVNNAAQIPSLSAQKVLERLKGANLLLDELSIFTIHSFCQKTLNEFAFETQQAFGQELVPDLSDTVQKSSNEYWRHSISTCSPEVIEILKTNQFSKENLDQVLMKSLSGKQFVHHGISTEQSLAQYSKCQSKRDVAEANFVKTFEISNERQLSNFNKNSNALKLCGHLTEDAFGFMTAILGNNSQYVEKLFPNLKALALEYQTIQNELSDNGLLVVSSVYAEAIEKTKAYIDTTKKRLNVLTYDDLISNLHSATLNNLALKTAIQAKYKALFIDEFQDTDQKQYDIFNRLFEGKTIFFIGDPKQAIYGFRGADLETYINAKAQIEHHHHMNGNFRSSARLIGNLNRFFGAIENPFIDPKIQYIDVEQGQGNHIGNLTLNRQPQNAFAFCEVEKIDEGFELAAKQIVQLLSQNYEIDQKKVLPSDIGVLVRSKKDGRAMKSKLTNYNIPSIQIDDQSIWDTQEAEHVQYILEAILSPNVNKVRKGLYSPFTAIDTNYLLSDALEDDIDFFIKLDGEWRTKSIYNALSLFFTYYQCRSYLLEQKKGGDRILSNFQQINELLHQKALENLWVPEQVLQWLKKAREGRENAQYEQRIESDNQAVKIVTIHKSKGLSYPIVFLPKANFAAHQTVKNQFVEFKKDNQNCFSLIQTTENINAQNQQSQQEDRRLLYVALTRAVYKNYIYFKKGSGALSPFIQNLYQNPEFESLSKIENVPLYKPEPSSKPLVDLPQFDMTVQRTWGTMSYSKLAEAIESHAYRQGSELTGYDEFVFNLMPKGPRLGNFVHELFEKADFIAHEFAAHVEAIGLRYSAIYNPKFTPFYVQLIQSVLQAKLGRLGFKLNDILSTKKWPELEFYFNVDAFKIAEINSLSHLWRVSDTKILKGLMYGFIDLLFEHEGQYYILDWKSNYLGDQIEDYDTESLEKAMTEHNYHLQYSIYTVAIYRMLSLRLPNFNYDTHFGGIVYVFLRACRADQEYGIYIKKPEYQMIKRLDQLLK